MLLKIGGKEYKANVTIGLFEKVKKKYKVEGIKTDGKDDTIVYDKKGNVVDGLEYSTSIVWTYLNRRWYGLKPFVFKFRMKNAMTFEEFHESDAIISNEYKLEDKEGGN